MWRFCWTVKQLLLAVLSACMMISFTTAYQCSTFNFQQCAGKEKECLEKKTCLSNVNTCYVVYMVNRDKDLLEATMGGCYNSLTMFKDCNVTSCSHTLYTRDPDYQFCCCHGNNCNGGASVLRKRTYAQSEAGRRFLNVRPYHEVMTALPYGVTRKNSGENIRNTKDGSKWKFYWMIITIASSVGSALLLFFIGYAAYNQFKIMKLKKVVKQECGEDEEFV